MEFPGTCSNQQLPPARSRTPATMPVLPTSASCTSSSSFSASRLSRRRLLAGCLLALSLLSQVSHAVNCVEPSAGTFKAGDPVTLNWSPGLGEEITDISAALNCNTGNKIADIPLTGTAGPQTWTIPSVGNATTPGGTTGPCAQNSFYVQYNGKLKGFLINPSFGPVRCPTIIISPAPNNNFTTTPGTSPTGSTGSSTGTGKSTSSGSGGNVSPTNPADDKGPSEPQTHVVIIVAIVAVLILALVAVAIVWRMRKQRRKRMEDAIMPWSSTNNNQFSKMSSSSMDDGHRPHATAAAAAVGLNKAQPAVPQPTHDYHQDEGYAYNQYPHKQGYSDVGYNEGAYNSPEDEYYNPYYATGTPASTHPTYYSGRTPHHDAHVHANSSGYFPAPPPLNANAHGGMGLASGAVSPALASTSLSSATLVSSSSHLRGPQALVNTEPMSEMSNQSDKRGQRGSPQAIPMKVLSPGT